MLYRVAGFDSRLFFYGPNRSISARAAKGYKLVINTVSASMSMDEVTVVRLFLSSVYVTQYVLYLQHHHHGLF